MSDIIRRKDAMEAMRILEKEDNEMYGCPIPECFDSKRAIEALEKLPSAEPEQKWIPVTERLPEYGERVLTTTEVGSRGKKVRSGTYTKNLFQCDNGDVWTVTDKEVLAWMHCPEPWRGE